MLERLKHTFKYGAPTLTPLQTMVTAPYDPPLTPNLERLPAFIVQAPSLNSQLLESLERAVVADTENGTLNVDGVEAMCNAQSLCTMAHGLLNFLYRSREICTKYDVFLIAITIMSDVEGIVGAGYGDIFIRQEQHPLADQTPDHFLGKNRSRLVVWEDEHWEVFNHCVLQILGLLPAKKESPCCSAEKKSMGERFYTSLFVIILGILIVPGNVPMVDTAPFAIPLLSACTSMLQGHPPDDSPVRLTQARNLSLHFSLSDYEPRTIALARLEGSSTLQVPTLHIHERLCIGVTGIVYKATAGLVIKAIPPRWKGEDDLRHGALVYESLSALQGSVLPHMTGCFEGEGWFILAIEDCRSAVTDVNMLSMQQRETLWWHVCAVHVHGVQHNDLKLRNLVVSVVGDVRIIDYAYAELGHECDEATCDELCHFRKLLCLV
ncbi:hypothetical protein C8R44DRAFT_887491 [Mycena epipterygia]|nr:hypothetical protein C8R44DRAFT_887491 [Mycena epipterygia]